MPKTNTAPKTNGQHCAATSAEAAERERYEAMIRELDTPADTASPQEGTLADYAAPFAAPELPHGMDEDDLNRRLANIAPNAEARLALATNPHGEPADAPPFTKGVYAWLVGYYSGGFVLRNASVGVRATREFERKPPRHGVTGAVTGTDGRTWIRRRCWLTGSVFDLPADAPCPILEADVYNDRGERQHNGADYIRDSNVIHPKLLEGGPEAFAKRLPVLFNNTVDELARWLLEIYKIRSLAGQHIGGAWPAPAWNVEDGRQKGNGQEGPIWKDTLFSSTVF